MATQYPFSTGNVAQEIMGARPDLPMFGAISKSGMSPFQQSLFRNRSSDMMNRFYGAAGRDLMEGMMPSQTPQGFFGNFDFQKELFDMPRFTRGSAANIHNPRTRFLYGF
tara:strand:+ start:433 stop:762 length:330 start_codon:yes stop_codon:yes gene_type:complete